MLQRPCQIRHFIRYISSHHSNNAADLTEFARFKCYFLKYYFYHLLVNAASQTISKGLNRQPYVLTSRKLSTKTNWFSGSDSCLFRYRFRYSPRVSYMQCSEESAPSRRCN